MIFHHPGVRLLGLYLEVAIYTAGWWFGTFGLFFPYIVNNTLHAKVCASAWAARA